MPRAKRSPSRESRFLRRYIEEIHRHPLLSVDEEKELALRIREGDEDALRRLVEGNLRFVVMIAKEYKDTGMPLADLINEGNLGLIEAARRYDVTRGVKFISYAVWWIRQSILQAIAKYNRTVRVPVNYVWAMNRMAKTSDRLKQKLGRDPSLEEIAQEMDTKPSRLRKELLRYQARVEISLDQPIAGDSDTVFGERIPDTDVPPPDEPFREEAFRSELETVLRSLERREAEIVRLFFGLGHDRPYTLSEIGEVLGISRERVRQLKNRAIRKLQHASRRKRLRAFLG